MKIEKKISTKTAARRNARRDRQVARIDAMLAKMIPYDEWLARGNRTELQKEIVRGMPAALKEIRQELITYGPGPRVITVRNGTATVS